MIYWLLLIIRAWLRSRLHGCRSPAEDPAAHHQLTDPATDHPRLAPDPAALVAGMVEDPAAVAPAAGVLITAASVPDPVEDPAAHHQLTDPAADLLRLAPDPAALLPVADLRYLIKR